MNASCVEHFQPLTGFMEQLRTRESRETPLSLLGSCLVANEERELLGLKIRGNSTFPVIDAHLTMNELCVRDHNLYEGMGIIESPRCFIGAFFPMLIPVTISPHELRRTRNSPLARRRGP